MKPELSESQLRVLKKKLKAEIRVASLERRRKIATELREYKLQQKQKAKATLAADRARVKAQKLEHLQYEVQDLIVRAVRLGIWKRS